MASFKCSGCGRTDFFTSHGFAKHGRKCKGKSSKRVDPISGGTYDSRNVFKTRSGATGLRSSTPSYGSETVPAWEKVKGAEYDASELTPRTIVGPASVPWTVYAYASDYNSRNMKGGRPYIAHGSGPLTGSVLLAHAKKVADHADKQGAARFFEFFKIARRPDGGILIVMLFGS